MFSFPSGWLHIHLLTSPGVTKKNRDRSSSPCLHVFLLHDGKQYKNEFLGCWSRRTSVYRHTRIHPFPSLPTLQYWSICALSNANDISRVRDKQISDNHAIRLVIGSAHTIVSPRPLIMLDMWWSMTSRVCDKQISDNHTIQFVIGSAHTIVSPRPLIMLDMWWSIHDRGCIDLCVCVCHNRSWRGSKVRYSSSIDGHMNPTLFYATLGL